MTTGVITNIQKYSIHDGPGIRSTVFFKGCPLLCHNPQNQVFTTEMSWRQDKCIGCGSCIAACPVQALTATAEGIRRDAQICTLCGACADVCPTLAWEKIGMDYTVEAVLEELAKDAMFYEQSHGGVTVSGGEPLSQAAFVTELLKACKEKGWHTAVDTCGFVPVEAFKQVLPYTDLFLYDIKCVTPELHLRHIGVSNERIIDNYLRLLSIGADVIVRVPMICEFNANDSEFNKIADFLRAHRPRMVELLPYHALGENKYRALSLGSPTAYHAPDESNMLKYKQMIGDITS